MDFRIPSFFPPATPARGQNNNLVPFIQQYRALAVNRLLLSLAQDDVPANSPLTAAGRPTNGSEIKGTITIKGTATDEDGSIEKVEISINGGEWVAVTGIDSWNYEWDSTDVKNGEYEIKVKAFDGEDYSEEIVWNVKVKNEKDDGDDGPGFEIAVLLFALVSCLHVFRKRK